MNGYQLITLWCEQFVGRAPSPQDIANGQALQTQAQAVALLAALRARRLCRPTPETRHGLLLSSRCSRMDSNRPTTS
jgi:hypothetical protein